MSEPTQIGKVLVYEDVTVEDLSQMLNENIITLKEYLVAMNTGKVENDKIRVYKTKLYKK